MPAVPPSANPTSAVPNEPAKPAVSKEPLKPPVADERPKSAVPDEQDTEEKTLDEAPQANAIGPDTDEISEYSEEDHGRNDTVSHSAGIYRRMRPLLRSRQVKGLFIANSIFVIINVLLLLAIFAFTVPIGITERNYAREIAKDVPCYYEWAPWSECSATCYGGGGPPIKTRQVNPSSVVRARGKYENTHKCPPGLLDLVDKMPCNVHKCPISLDKLEWRNETYSKNPSDPDADCYVIRDIPMDSAQLIVIDVPNLINITNCTGADTGSSKRRSSHIEL